LDHTTFTMFLEDVVLILGTIILCVSSDFFCFFDPEIDYEHERSSVN
jgi:hypothetical protein